MLVSVSLSKEVYDQIREKYQDNTYLVKVKEALEHPEGKDAKRLSKQLRQYESQNGLIFFKDSSQDLRLCLARKSKLVADFEKEASHYSGKECSSISNAKEKLQSVISIPT
ncbi:3052_t:CDS:2 [Gigaspora margarita]|uniref:3052_t:CDS:1 n=1 Tax=Gigaspora margarita TaxID=4874 RepID=A0ABN7V2E9_GIGMA|nr:3052_t:CDS:2 [Gigaspora margarita]